MVLWAECLLTRSVNITNPYRYRCLALATKLVFGNAKISVADIGCGFYPFGIGYQGNDMIPMTEDGKEIVDFLGNYSRIEAVDLQNPDPAWTAACQWEPLNTMRLTAGLYRKLLDESEINFTKADMVNDALKFEKVDAVFCANILYQIPKEMRVKAMTNLRGVLKDDGRIITADFLPGGSRRRPFSYAIQTYKVSDVGLNNGEVVLVLENADCMKVKSSTI